jgi:hypothetical protein
VDGSHVFATQHRRDVNCEAMPQVGIESAERFVEQENSWPRGKSTCQCDALRLPPAQTVDLAALEPLEFEPVQEFADANRVAVTLQAKPVRDVASDVEVREQQRFLKDNPDASMMNRLAGDIGAINEDVPGQRRNGPENCRQQSGLTDAARTYDGEDLAGLKCEGQRSGVSLAMVTNDKVSDLEACGHVVLPARSTMSVKLSVNATSTTASAAATP